MQFEVPSETEELDGLTGENTENTAAAFDGEEAGNEETEEEVEEAEADEEEIEAESEEAEG